MTERHIRRLRGGLLALAAACLALIWGVLLTPEARSQVTPDLPTPCEVRAALADYPPVPQDVAQLRAWADGIDDPSVRFAALEFVVVVENGGMDGFIASLDDGEGGGGGCYPGDPDTCCNPLHWCYWMSGACRTVDC